MSEEARDELAIMRAKMDQAKAAGREFAEAIAVYRSALIEYGVPEQDALALTIAYQGTMVIVAMNQASEGGGDGS